MADAGVRPVVVVGVEEVDQCGSSCLLGVVFADVGPFLGQRAIETLRLPVGPERVGPGALVRGPGLLQGISAAAGPVAGAVVGEYSGS